MCFTGQAEGGDEEVVGDEAWGTGHPVVVGGGGDVRASALFWCLCIGHPGCHCVSS